MVKRNESSELMEVERVPLSPAQQREIVEAAFTARHALDASALTVEIRESLNGSNFIALRPDGEAIEAIRANVGDSDDMMLSSFASARVPSGGGTRFRVSDASGESEAAEIEGVICLCHPRGALWPSEDAVEGTLPYLVTNDLLTAVRLGDDSGDLDVAAIEACRLPSGGDMQVRYDWTKLPYTKWGTSSKGSGRAKRAKESRLLAILRQGDSFPILLSAPPTSVKGVKAFLFQLSPTPHYRATVKATLSEQKNQTGQKYARIELRKVGELSHAEGAMIRNLYTEPLRRLVVSGRLVVEASDFHGDES